MYQTFFEEAFTEYEVGATEDDEERIKERVVSGEAECAFVLHSPTSYTYYVDNLSIYDSRTAIADTVLENVYQINAMAEGGMSPEQVNEALSVKIEGETQNLGKDQMQNFFYTYIMIFALYMASLTASLFNSTPTTRFASPEAKIARVPVPQ